MIRFIKENGETFDGVYPYIHWMEGQLSVGLWYTIKLMFVSDQQIIQTSELPEDSIYRFVTPDVYDPSYEGVELDLSTISARSIMSTGISMNFGDPPTVWYIHQILLVCKSDNAGEYIENFTIGDDVVAVGVDLYDLDETLQINLSNRGLELPLSIQKAFLETNINEDDVNYALINRKFKELVSNFIDIVDCKGSYKSLYNSLKWFEWGESTKLYEVWKGNNMYIEKELKPVLSNIYSSFLSTYRKTTHLSLITAVQKLSQNIIVDPSDSDFNDRNPNVEDLRWSADFNSDFDNDFSNTNLSIQKILNKWSKEELALKVSLLGLFFERYFMPIHLDLKRACIECLATTNQIKILSGSHKNKWHYHEDTGIINIDMDHTVTLGNVDTVAVGPDTVFGRSLSNADMAAGLKVKQPIGVDYLRNIGLNNDSEIAPFFLQLKGGVGVVVPIKVKVKLPEDDAIKTENICVYRYRDGQDTPIQSQTTDYRLYKPNDEGYVEFSFNLFSDQEEKVSFTIMLVSISGHVWTRSSSYEAVDPAGSYLDIYNVTNNSMGFESVDEWISNNKFVPWNSQFSPYSSPNDQSPKSIIQYLPYQETQTSLFNQLIVIENLPLDPDATPPTWDTEWMSNSTITSDFWVIGRSDSAVTKDNPRYALLIAKTPGKFIQSKTAFVSTYGNLIGTNFSQGNIKRFNMIYIPQLQNYTNIESDSGIISLNQYTFSQTDLLCIVPQFRRTVANKIDASSVFWEYENKTTLEKIHTHTPIQTPLVTNNTALLLSPGYWTVTMYYKFNGSNEIHKLTKNSAFKIIK